MDEQFSRTAALLGEEGIERLKASSVAVFGVGGVGGFAAEALARSGVGRLDLFDKDCVSVSNLNRQIIALHSTIGKPKAQVMKERILDINPAARVNAYEVFYLPENAADYDLSQYDYIIDAVDTVTAKLEIIMRAKAAGVPVISCMGAGNKLNPSGFKVADIYSTSVCPLARVMRNELKKRGVKGLDVVYSEEQPRKALITEEGSPKAAPGSLAFIPSVAGLTAAGFVIKRLSCVN